MARNGADFSGPLRRWIAPLESWLQQTGCSPGRALRTINAFGRLSSWMAARGLTGADLNEDVLDEHIRAERLRSGSTVTGRGAVFAAGSKRFLASRDLWCCGARPAGTWAGCRDCRPDRWPTWSPSWRSGCAPTGMRGVRRYRWPALPRVWVINAFKVQLSPGANSTPR